MTEFIEIARAFCRECLGWNCPVHRRNRKGPPQIQVKEGRNVLKRFEYSDLSQVAAAVREWAERNDILVTLLWGADKYVAECDAWHQGEEPDHARSEVAHADPCQALLAACVEANRKLNVGALERRADQSLSTDRLPSSSCPATHQTVFTDPLPHGSIPSAARISRSATSLKYSATAASGLPPASR